ncbi:hypothetical protein [Moritella sp. F3]|nr:hypothetical protein [Moritella sp. F3]
MIKAIGKTALFVFALGVVVGIVVATEYVELRKVVRLITDFV